MGHKRGQPSMSANEVIEPVCRHLWTIRVSGQWDTGVAVAASMARVGAQSGSHPGSNAELYPAFAAGWNALWYRCVKYPGTKPHSALPVELVHQPDDEEVVTLAVPGYRQVRNYSCGYIAVLMVLRHFGSQVAGEQLFAALGTTRAGTGQSAIINVLRDQGLRAGVRYDMAFANVQRSIDSGKVLIAYLTDEHHWIVLYGYGRNPPRVFAADPEPGKLCEYDWQSYGERLGGFAIVCSPRKDSVLSAPSASRSEKDMPSSQETRRAAGTLAPANGEQLSFGFGESS